MHCRASAELMSLRLDGMLGPEETRRLEEHMSSCGNCRAQYLLLREADSLMRSSARRPLSPPDDFTIRVMQRVAATPVQRPNLWERERNNVQGGRQTVRLTPTGPITGGLVPIPLAAGSMAPGLQPAQNSLLQGLDVLRGRGLRLFVGGLSAAGVLSVMIVSMLVWMWSSGSVAAPSALNVLGTGADAQSLLVSATSLWRLAEGLVLQIDPLLAGLAGALMIVLAALWWRTVTWYFRRKGREVAA